MLYNILTILNDVIYMWCSGIKYSETRNREVTWRLRMRLSRDLIFLCGQRGMPNSLHFLFSTVRPTFKFLEASTIGRPKHLTTSSKAILAMSSLAALFFFFSITPAVFWLVSHGDELQKSLEVKKKYKYSYIANY